MNYRDFHIARCYGAGGPDFSDEEFAVLQQYVDIMESTWRQGYEAVQDFARHLSDSGVYNESFASYPSAAHAWVESLSPNFVELTQLSTGAAPEHVKEFYRVAVRFLALVDSAWGQF
jgi:hypothetical protein